MAGQKTLLVSHKSAVLWLIGFTICYQIAYQAFMYRTLQREAMDGECQAPMGSGFADSSPHCAEVQLFRSWQEKDTELHSLASEEPAGQLEAEEHLVKESVPVKHFGEITTDVHNMPLPLRWTNHTNAQGDAANASTPASGGRNASHDTAHGALAAIAEATAAATAAAAAHNTDTGASKLQQVGTPEKAVSNDPNPDRSATNRTKEQSSSPLTAWAQGLEDLQHRLEVHMEQLPSMHHKHAHERHEQMESLMDAVATSLNSSSGAGAMTPWAEQLVELQQHLEEGIKSRHHEHHHQQPLSTTTEVSLLERIYRVGKEMCVTPDHRDRPECAQFLNGENASSASVHGHALSSSHKANLTEEVEMQHVRLEKRLAELQADRKAWEEVFVAKVKGDAAALGQSAQATPGAAAEAPRTALRKGRVYVHWKAVTAWHGPRWWENSAGLSSVTREQAQGAHWSGMIPKVACITSISSGIHATVQMRYFIDNFHLQSYEGPRQLVLVYHYTDKKAAQLVQKYADGVSIRGVAARNEEAFPSTTGLRYGAWITDADVIARWDFDEWHHPNRLSLQVRALALSTRPACLLQDSKDEELPRESSVVGESAWMRRHWRPFAANESLILDSAQAERVVELRATGLRHGGHKTPSITSSITVSANATRVEREATGWSSTCSRVMTTRLSTEVHDSLEGSIGAKVGQQMQEKYKGLATRRRDAAQKLRSLCIESAAETDQQRKERLDNDVERMSAIIEELDKHFTTLNSLFSSGKPEATGSP